MQVQHRVHSVEVDAEVAVHERIAKPGEGTELSGKLTRDDTEIAKLFDGGGVVSRIPTRGRDQVGRHVENVLDAQLQSALDRPAVIEIRAQALDWPSGMASQVRQGLVEGDQMSANGRDVHLSRAHRPNLPAAIRW